LIERCHKGVAVRVRHRLEGRLGQVNLQVCCRLTADGSGEAARFQDGHFAPMSGPLRDHSEENRQWNVYGRTPLRSVSDLDRTRVQTVLPAVWFDSFNWTNV
jgi:hypothetical protein